jgi:hypothetical protein
MIIPERVLHCQSYLRQMRGGSRPELWRAEDGNLYVVKRIDNPQGRRILINEVISHAILTAMQIPTPPLRFMSFNVDPCQTDIHLGSLYPGGKEEIAIYDFLPDPLLAEVENLYHFFGVLVHDQWVSNTDQRQCIFYRARVLYPDGRSVSNFVVSMIDNGYALGGEKWKFIQSAIIGVYVRIVVYGEQPTYRHFEPWVEMVHEMSWEVLREAVAAIPFSWLHGEDNILSEHLERLWKRREWMRDMVRETVKDIQMRVRIKRLPLKR